ncbi:hypothetical protein FNV43_RR14668 [Rhamnella rubrinervis]|uniref:Uncharacterized protein n=1 Tax=Rhamnella rubrinervis TaxID=2594499 RepID=A0A8K0H3R8_9ROSA|nr:hypothetical protein FNV43_RR14668 [Rhamnella rubrinervis]
MEDTPLTQISLPTFRRKQPKTHQKSSINAVRNDCLSRRSRRADTKREIRRNRRETVKVLVQKKDGDGDGDDDDEQQDDEKEEVERRIQALQRIVPGGESLGVDKLFEETAGYIIALQCQLKAMRTLTNLFEGLEKEKRKLGG